MYIDPASLDSCGRRKTAPRASRCADRSQNTAARKKYRPIGATFSESRQYWPPTGARSVALCTRVVARPRRRRAQRSPRKSARFAGRESKRTTPTDETRSRRPRRLRRLRCDREPRVVRSPILRRSSAVAEYRCSTKATAAACVRCRTRPHVRTRSCTVHGRKRNETTTCLQTQRNATTATRLYNRILSLQAAERSVLAQLKTEHVKYASISRVAAADTRVRRRRLASIRRRRAFSILRTGRFRGGLCLRHGRSDCLPGARRRSRLSPPTMMTYHIIHLCMLLHGSVHITRADDTLPRTGALYRRHAAAACPRISV